MQGFEKVTQRFLEYIKIDTQSKEDSDTFPSTQKQKRLAKVLAVELEEMGASDVFLDETYGYVYAKIPGNQKQDVQETIEKKKSTLGFVAHMDTAPAFSGTGINPKMVPNYDGSVILLQSEDGISHKLDPLEFPNLKNYIGQDLITTDGSTLLGADDKAGVAEIMTMAEYLLTHPDITHPEIAIAFTPDEEVGAGVDHIDLEKFGADYAYTVDGGALGELEYENFHAAGAVILVKGKSVHPGDAKDKMKNAVTMAMEVEKRLPEDEKPEHTQGYQGFFHLTDMNGDVSNAKLSYIIRDHDREKFEYKKKLLTDLILQLNEEYGQDTFTLIIKDQYYNMADQIRPCMFLIDQARQAMQDLQIEPLIKPIRGGTDGARLSYMGLPCPNLCAGGENFHGPYEFCSIQSLEKITHLLVRICQIHQPVNQ